MTGATELRSYGDVEVSGDAGELMKLRISSQHGCLDIKSIFAYYRRVALVVAAGMAYFSLARIGALNKHFRTVVKRCQRKVPANLDRWGLLTVVHEVAAWGFVTEDVHVHSGACSANIDHSAVAPQFSHGSERWFVLLESVCRQVSRYLRPGILGARRSLPVPTCLLAALCARPHAEPGARTRESFVGHAKDESILKSREMRSGLTPEAAIVAELRRNARESRRASC
ncbi:hypothetical protein EVAR_5199_1 [Eumeta japonica]|uniref:Uncharacterized protein n=1 Tax=Eumeta variegata TaxID=151549 RepID=A0A4C1V4D3_EUMVA|nr:hypothetical protein EVAR_5199_1 [Eumeta japonica]